MDHSLRKYGKKLEGVGFIANSTIFEVDGKRHDVISFNQIKKGIRLAYATVVSKMKIAASVFVVFWLFTVSASSPESFVYVDHWPSGQAGETSLAVTVPAGVQAVIADEDDVAAVSRLKSICIEEGASVVYTASKDLVLGAALSGKGAFIGLDSALLTIAADNSALLAPGHFAFTNAKVLVSGEYGLGSRDTGAARFFFDSNSSLDFLANSEGVYTNRVALEVDCVPSKYNLRIGIQPRTARLVQDGGFAHLTGSTSGSKNVYIDGTMEFISGRMEVKLSPGMSVGQRPYLYFGAQGGISDVWFSGNMAFTLRYAIFAYDSNLRFHFNGPSNFDASLCGLNMFCEAPNVTVSTSIMPSTGAVLDLQGFDQTVRTFNNTYCGKDPVAETGTKKFTVTSEKPAIIATTSNSSITNAAAFTGAAGFRHANTGSGAFAYACSTSTNVLEVASGKFALVKGASWNGDVKVLSGATLELSSENALTNGVSKLNVEAGGKLVLRHGAGCIVGSAVVAGTELEAGMIYSVRMLRDTMMLPVDGDNSALIMVAKKMDAWNGWPNDGGVVVVPKGETVCVNDADCEKVSKLAGITLMEGSKLVFDNLATQLSLNADLSGWGTVEVRDSAGVVLSGDNSRLNAPGGFFFSNTPVVVAHRYALGAEGAAMNKFHYGDLDGDGLLFRGDGLTVHAPLTIYATNKLQRVIGPESMDDTLVFSNSFRIAGTHPTVYFRNKVRFAGGIFGTIDNNHLYSYKAGDYAEVWFDSDVRPHFYYWFAGSLDYHLAWDAVEWGYLVCPYVDGGRIFCYKDNLFKSLTTGYGAKDSENVLDLNGFDQQIEHFTAQYIFTHKMVVTSAVPATVTVVNSNNSKDSNFASVPACFRGAAAFTYAWTGTNEFRNFFSDTTGALTVEKGTFRLTDGAGWGGTNVFVRSGATLVVDGSSAACAFTQSGSSKTDLYIDEGGTIELDGGEVPVKVRTLTYNGVVLGAGIYDSSSGVGIAGTGRLSVKTNGRPGTVIVVR